MAKFFADADWPHGLAVDKRPFLMAGCAQFSFFVIKPELQNGRRIVQLRNPCFNYYPIVQVERFFILYKCFGDNRLCFLFFKQIFNRNPGGFKKFNTAVFHPCNVINVVYMAHKINVVSVYFFFESQFLHSENLQNQGLNSSSEKRRFFNRKNFHMILLV